MSTREHEARLWSAALGCRAEAGEDTPMPRQSEASRRAVWAAVFAGAERVKGVGPMTVCLNQRAIVLDGETTRTGKYRPEEQVAEGCKAAPSAGTCIDC